MSNHYTSTAKVMHWLAALCIFVMLPVGFIMTGMEFSPQKLQLYSWHKWLGVSIFCLTIIRFIWRVLNPPPPLPLHTERTIELLAKVGHFTLYALCLVIPLSGWLMSSAKGVQTVWFGVLALPDLLSKDKLLGEQLAEVHETLNWVLICVFSLHIIAALKHHFIDKDDVLIRILPRFNRK